jgi:hypothetical protein
MIDAYTTAERDHRAPAPPASDAERAPAVPAQQTQLSA